MSEEANRLRSERQARAIENVRAAMREGYFRVLVQGATGFGKTRFAISLLDMVLKRGKRALFTVPSINLVEQAILDFEAMGLTDIGVMQADHERTDYTAPLQIACCATLERRPMPQDIALIMQDEAHERQKIITKIIHDEAYRKIPVIGLSATPWTKGLGDDFNKLVFAGTMKDGLSEGWLCPYKVLRGPEIDKSEVKKTKNEAGEEEYQTKSASAKMCEPKIVGDVIQTWIQKAEGRSTFAFCQDRAHAMELHREFLKQGVMCAYQDGFTDRRERHKILRLFDEGFYRIILSVGTLKRGTDADVRCIIDAQMTKSPQSFVQGFGRGLRLAEGKDHLLYLDHANNTWEHGRPEDIHQDELSGWAGADMRLAAAPKVRKPRFCKGCGLLMPLAAVECPDCHYIPERISLLHAQEGELEEVEDLKGARKKIAKKQFDKQELYSQLLWIGQERGWNSKRPVAMYKEYFGVWPRGLSERPVRASFEVLQWVKSRQIAWIKSQQKKTAVVDAAAE